MLEVVSVTNPQISSNVRCVVLSAVLGQGGRQEQGSLPQKSAISMMVTMESLATALLRERWTVLATVLWGLDYCPVAGHDSSAARSVALTPGLPLAHLAIRHWNEGEYEKVEIISAFRFIILIKLLK